MASRPECVAAIYVVYDADGTRVGELLYMIRKLLGIAHCAACDITHGPRTEKPAFTRLKTAGWSVPLRNIHRDEMDAPLARAVGRVLPAVAARTVAGRDVLLLGPRQLDECGGQVGALEAAINAALAAAALATPPFPPRQQLPAGGLLPQDHRSKRLSQEDSMAPALHARNKGDTLHDDFCSSTSSSNSSSSNSSSSNSSSTSCRRCQDERCTPSSSDGLCRASVVGTTQAAAAPSRAPAPSSPVRPVAAVQQPTPAHEHACTQGSRPGSPTSSSPIPVAIPIARPAISRHQHRRPKRRFFDAGKLATALFGDLAAIAPFASSLYQADDARCGASSPSSYPEAENDDMSANPGESDDCDAVVPSSYM